MPCKCGIAAYGYCSYCREPGDTSEFYYGPILFKADSVLVLVGQSGSGKTTLGCCLMSALGGVVYGNEMSSYDDWGLSVVRSMPSNGHVLIDSLDSLKQPNLLRRRAGITVAITRLNATGGLSGGMGSLYDSDVLLSLDTAVDKQRGRHGQLTLFKTRYQAGAGSKYDYWVKYPEFEIAAEPTED